MKYVNAAVSLRSHPDFADANLEQVGAWTLLFWYCHEHENFGTISNCKSWPDKKWLRLIGIHPASVVLTNSPLWTWRGQSLEVHHYNKREQEKHERMVLQRKNAANARWHPSKKSPRKDAEENAGGDAGSKTNGKHP